MIHLTYANKATTCPFNCCCALFYWGGTITQKVLAHDETLKDRAPYVEEFIQTKTMVNTIIDDVADIKKNTDQTKNDVAKIKGALGVD